MDYKRHLRRFGLYRSESYISAPLCNSNNNLLPRPSSLKTLASHVKFPNGNYLIHELIANFSEFDNSSEETHTQAFLLSLCCSCTLNTKNAEGLFPLHLAVKKNNFVLAHKLLSHFPDLNVNAMCGKYRDTALHLAVSLGRFKMNKTTTTTTDDDVKRCECRFRNGLYFDGSICRICCNPTLEPSLEERSINFIRSLILRGALVNAKNGRRSTPLHEAVRSMRLENVEVLIDQGAKVDSRIPFLRSTPLMTAVEMGAVDIVELLLSHGADYNVVDDRGTSPLHLAVKYGRSEIVEILLNRGADVNFQNKNGNTPLHLATFRVLVFDSKQIEFRSLQYLSPYAKDNVLKIVKLLVMNGADVNVKNEEGETPYHRAVQSCVREVVEFLESTSECCR